MPKFVLKDARVEINSVDLSDHVESLTINYGAETPDMTSMQDITRRRLPGLIDWTVDVTFRSDFDAGKVDATLFPLVGANAFPIKIRPTSGAISAVNPEFQGNALCGQYNPIQGTVGDTANSTVTFTGDGTLTRAVA